MTVVGSLNRSNAATSTASNGADDSVYTVKRGDSLSRIARNFGVSLEDLLNANPNIQNEHNINVGQELNIPSPGSAPAELPQGADAPAPARRRNRNPANADGSFPRGGDAKRTPMNGANRGALESRLPGARDNGTAPNVAATTGPDAASRPGGDFVRAADLPTTGATARTARQDGLREGGVESSRRMAQNDLGRVERYREEFQEAGRRHNIDPAILAAIASRESRGGNALDSRGLGDNGNGFGLMQVDKRYHRPAGGPYSGEHIDQAAGILANFRDQIARENPGWTQQQVMKAAISAYNTGNDRWSDPSNTDSTTTGRDYANDVIARAQYYSEQGF